MKPAPWLAERRVLCSRGGGYGTPVGHWQEGVHLDANKNSMHGNTDSGVSTGFLRLTIPKK